MMYLNKLSRLININLNKYTIIFISLFVLTAFFEIFGLSTILLFLNEIISQGEDSELSKRFYNLLSENFNIEKKDYLILITILLFLVFLIKNLIIFFLEIFKNNFFAKSQKLLSSRLYNDFLDTDYQKYTKSTASKLLTNIITEVENIFQNILQSVFVFYSEIFIFTSIFIFLIIYNFKVTFFLGIVFALIVLTLAKFIKKKNVLWGKKRQISLQELNLIITKSFSSFKEIKLNNTENLLKGIFLENAKNFSNSIAFLNTIQNIPRLFFEIVIIGLVCILILFYLILDNQLESILITITVFAAAAIRLAPTANRIYVNSTTKEFFQISLESVLSQIKLFKLQKKNKKIKKVNLKTFESIKLKNVKFKYQEKRSKNILNIKNLYLFKGKTYCIVGPNGSGKTTFLDLLCGLLQPTDGKITINGKDLKKINLSNAISYCPQEPYVFSDTIIKNIIGDKKINNKNLRQSIEISGIKNVFKKNNDYLNLKLGANAINLSGGQKQMINIAKTLYQNKHILIFDEPTSYLSDQISKKFIEAIQKIKKDKLIIVCSHNKSLFKYFDKIIDIRKF